MAFPVEICDKNIKLWLEAAEAAANGKAYSIDGVSLTRQDLGEIRKMIRYWQREKAAAEGRPVGDVRFRSVVPCDGWTPPRF